jgi:hypothetical protein
LLFVGSVDFFWGVIVLFSAYFVVFNIFEVTLSSIIFKLVPVVLKGIVIGVYNIVQLFGVFVGGVLGGYLLYYHGCDSAKDNRLMCR